MDLSKLPGIWHCHLVTQERSESNPDGGDDLEDDRDPVSASSTEHAGTTLEIRQNKTYKLQSEDGTFLSEGRWSEENEFSLEETECQGFESLDSAALYAGGLVLDFKLIPDAHDGLDLLGLHFRSEPLPLKNKANAFVEQILAAKDDDEIGEALGDFFDDDEPDFPAQGRELWDAWQAGRFPDPGSQYYSLQIDVLDTREFKVPGAFGYEHAFHALEHCDPEAEEELVGFVCEQLACLDADAVKEEKLAKALSVAPPAWVKRLTELRFVGGGLEEKHYHRPLMPQPIVDDSCREFLRNNAFTRFEAIEHLFPRGHAYLPEVLLHYRGSELLTLPMKMGEEHGILKDMLRAIPTLQTADYPGMDKASLWLSQVTFTVVLSDKFGEPLPAELSEVVATKKEWMTQGCLDASEKELVRESLKKMPAKLRKNVCKFLSIPLS